MPFFRIRNVLNYCKSIFYSKIDCGKDTLYRFKRDNSINFRKINFHIAKKLRNCIDDGTDNNSKLPECLIIDDTDLEKTGYCFELHGFKAKYVLAVSWFCSIELIRFVIKTLKINFLGMAKHGDTKYFLQGM